MQACDLTNKKCVPCEGGVPPLKEKQVKDLLEGLEGWTANGVHHIEKEWVLKDFVSVLAGVNRIGEVAESEGHHPDLLIHQYKKLRVTLWTHAIGGLSENDFIVAAKIDALRLG